MGQKLAFVLAIFGAIGTVFTIVGFLLQYGGRMKPLAQFFTNPKVILVVVACSLILSTLAILISFPRKTSVTVFPKMYDFTEITNRHFLNESVVLDGYRFEHCEFVNVTFVWNGSGPFEIINCDRHGAFRLNSKNDAINSTLRLLVGFKFLADISEAPQLHELMRVN